MGLLSYQDYRDITLDWLAQQDEQKTSKRRTSRARSPELHDANQTGVPDFLGVARAARALARIDASRCDQYDTWIGVGMALSELGAVGLSMWDGWSKQSGKYKPGDCSGKWPTFTPGDGITLASLDVWANEDDPHEAPGDGCTRPTCLAKDEVIETQRRRIQELETKYESVRVHNVEQKSIQTSHTVEAASKRDTIAVVHTELKRADRDEDGYATIPMGYVAAVKGQSRSTVRKHLVEMHDLGFIDRKVETVRQPDGAIKREVKIKELVDLADPNLVWPSMHGGKRVRCHACQSDDLMDVTSRYCRACGEKQGEDKVTPVNPPLEEREEETQNAADTTMEHHAPWSEITLDVRETAPASEATMEHDAPWSDVTLDVRETAPAFGATMEHDAPSLSTETMAIADHVGASPQNAVSAPSFPLFAGVVERHRAVRARRTEKFGTSTRGAGS